MISGPYNPASREDEDRLPRMVMRPQPQWNRLGPMVSTRWRRALARISPRLVLQFVPHGRIAGRGSRGFWAVYLRLGRSGWLYKQAVMNLCDPTTGRFRHPSWADLRDIRKAWWQHKHEGLEAIYDSIDRNIAADEAAYEAEELERLTDMVDRSIARLDPSAHERQVCRIVVPSAILN